MSSRRNGSVSRAAEAASKNRLHMDRNPQHSRITDPSNPAGRRKEIDNVMKRARQASPGSWDRRLLEVEEKDPNRWRHTGYKQMYLEGAGSTSPRRSRSPVLGRRATRSPLGRRSRSPAPRRKSRSPRRSPRRSPIRRSPRRRSPRARSPPARRESPRPPRAPRAPPPLATVTRVRPPEPPQPRKAASPAEGRAPRPRARPAPPVPRRPPSPPGSRKSTSGSSGSSCSDESCSVCSAKNKKGPPPPPPKGAKPPPRPSSKSPGRVRAGGASAPAGSGARAVQPTRELLKAREGSKRSREEKVLEWQRSQLGLRGSVGGAAAAPAPAPVPIPGVQIKREGQRDAPTDPRRRPRVDPAAIAAALNDSDTDSESDASSDQQPQRLTLSERFGKMAQWSADRSARLENMRITRREATLHVRIERDPAGDVRPQADTAYPGIEPVAPVGSYPEELLAAAPGGLPSWDDVTVRYDYYKKRGYLRGLTLGDYVKWEEWWYKYQEWLERERAYERWAEGETRPSGRRDRRRKGGRHRRS